MGRKPDYDVKVAVKYKSRGGEERRKWYTVGAAWVDDKFGMIYFDIYTSPGAEFKMEPYKEKEEKKDETKDVSDGS